MEQTQTLCPLEMLRNSKGIRIKKRRKLVENLKASTAGEKRNSNRNLRNLLEKREFVLFF